MREYWKVTVEKATGARLMYNYRDAWGQRYYSFDDGSTWHPSKMEAYTVAKVAGALVPAPVGAR